jgi:hypothetical protein
MTARIFAMARRRKSKPASWWNLAMLALESQQVIFMRTIKLAAGGPAASTESVLMVSEKIHEAMRAGQQLMFGASADSVVHRYRKKVRANAKRLAK